MTIYIDSHGFFLLEGSIGTSAAAASAAKPEECHRLRSFRSSLISFKSTPYAHQIHSLSLPFSIFIFQQKTPFRHSPKPTKHHSTTPNDVPPPPPRRHNQPAPRAIPLPPTRTTPDPDPAAPAPPQQLQHHHSHKHRPVLRAAPTPGSRTVHPLCARAAHLHHAAGAV